MLQEKTPMKSPDKDVFYEQLRCAIDDTPSHNVLLAIGELNAKSDAVNTDKRSNKEGFSTMHNNGERLVEIYQENNLVIGAGLFQHLKSNMEIT